MIRESKPVEKFGEYSLPLDRVIYVWLDTWKQPNLFSPSLGHKCQLIEALLSPLHGISERKEKTCQSIKE